MLSWLFDMIVGADGPAIRAMLDEEDNKEKAKRERAKYMARINKTDKAAETVAKEYIRTYPDKLTGYQIVKVSDLPWLFVWNEKLHQYVPKKTEKPQKCDTDELPLSLQFRR